MLGLFTDLEWESSSDGGSSEQEENEFSYVLQAQNIFSSLEESIGKIDDFLTFDRGFMHGDIVRSITDPSGQMGRVVSLNMRVDLENVYGKVIKEVDSKKLQKVRSVSVGDYVTNGAWLGKVDKVVDSVAVLLDDGSKFEVTVSDPDKLVPVSPNLLEDLQYLYYPGQRVQVRLTHTPKPSRWLCGNLRENQDLGTVCAVDAGLVYVDWIASVVMGGDLSLAAPPSLQEPKNLTLLSCFPHVSWQLGDWCIFPVSSCKVTIKRNTLRAHNYDLLKDHKKLERGFQGTNSSLDELFVIVKTKMKIDVVWQDGSCSSAVDAHTLLPVGAVNSHEFWPEQFVLEKEIFDSQKWGVVRAVDAKEQTVKVQWRTKPENANDSSANQKEETVSAYELLEHPDFAFCFNDVVFRVVQNLFKDTSLDDHSRADINSGKEATSKEKTIGKDDPEMHYLSCIGMVTGFRAGAVEVKWADGFISEVAPYEIYRIEKSEGSTSATVNFDESAQELNQKVTESDKTSAMQQGKDLMKFIGAGKNCNKHRWESSSFSFPWAAIGFLTNVAASLFGSQASTSLSCSMPCHDSEDQRESEILVEEEAIRTVDLSDPKNSCELGIIAQTCLNKEGTEGSKEDMDSTCSVTAKNLVGFRQFDMVNDCSDHHFLASSKGMSQSEVKRSWMKKVQQEWGILEANLPESIYVRLYEERMDLLRAALVGAPGTPYHDGLFFFDILLPPDYPYEPPLVHYNSGGLRVNPNLYESGKVCLSLLNTWTGTGSEVWNPESSTILQVLLSLQALVLNEKPYFNEAGYDKQLGRTEGEKNSVSYNENAFLGTCKSMLYILRKPPKHFEALVEKHFIGRAQHVLSACKASLEGAPLGFVENMQKSDGSSTGFKIMLGKLYPKLMEAFSEIGVDCSQSIELRI